jgi:hypothetical protein
MLPAMDSGTAVWIVDGLLVLIFFVGVPSIAVAIAYAAWKCRLKSFDRDSRPQLVLRRPIESTRLIGEQRGSYNSSRGWGLGQWLLGFRS